MPYNPYVMHWSETILTSLSLSLNLENFYSDFFLCLGIGLRF